MSQIDPGRIVECTIGTHRQPIQWCKRNRDLCIHATIFDSLGEFLHQTIHLVALRKRETFEPAFEIEVYAIPYPSM